MGLGSSRPLVDSRLMRHHGQVSFIGVVEICSFVVQPHLVLFFHLVDELVLGVLLRKKLGQSFGTNPSKQLFLPLRGKSIADVGSLGNDALLDSGVNLGYHVRERLLCVRLHILLFSFFLFALSCYFAHWSFVQTGSSSRVVSIVQTASVRLGWWLFFLHLIINLNFKK